MILGDHPLTYWIAGAVAVWSVAHSLNYIVDIPKKTTNPGGGSAGYQTPCKGDDAIVGQ
jgi:hypothetical protein